MTVEEPEGEGLPGVVSGQLCYLQIPAADAVQSANFYAAVFGWGVEHTYASFEAPQMIGQWVEGRAPTADAGMMLWINVDDLEEVIGLVLANGGEVLEPPRTPASRSLSCAPSRCRVCPRTRCSPGGGISRQSIRRESERTSTSS